MWGPLKGPLQGLEDDLFTSVGVGDTAESEVAQQLAVPLGRPLPVVHRDDHVGLSARHGKKGVMQTGASEACGSDVAHITQAVALARTAAPINAVNRSVLAKAVGLSARHHGAATERRLQASLDRLRDPAEPVFMIVVLGGSASTHGAYPDRLRAWLSATFPCKRINLVNAAIGATGGDIPSFCLKQMVQDIDLADLVLTEFSLNPTSAGHARRLYERVSNLPRSPPIIAIDFANGHADPRAAAANWGNQEAVTQAIADNLTVISTTSAAAPFWVDKRDAGADTVPWADRIVGGFHNGDGGYVDGDGYHPSQTCHLWLAHFVIEYIAAALIAPTVPRGHRDDVAGDARTSGSTGLCLTQFVMRNAPLIARRVSEMVDGPWVNGTVHVESRAQGLGGSGDWHAAADAKNGDKRYLSTGASKSAIGSWIEFEEAPAVDCTPHLGYLLSDKHELGSADVSIDGTNLTRVVVAADEVPFTIQGVKKLPIVLRAGRRYLLRVTVADSPPRVPKDKQYRPGYRFAVTGLYC